MDADVPGPARRPAHAGLRGDAAFVASAASCAVSTVIDGNSIAGTMTVAAYAAHRVGRLRGAVRGALSTDAGSVAVTRSGPDAQSIARGP